MLGLFQCLARLPLSWMQRLGAALGWLVWALSPTYRRNFKAHVKSAGIAWPQARPAIAAMGQMVAELPWSWMRAPDVKLAPHIHEWQGAELFESAMQSGRGVIFITPHIGCWELGAQAVAERFSPQFGPMVVLYRPARKAMLEAVVSKGRNRPGFVAVPTNTSGIRTLLRTLRSGGLVGLLPDQVPPKGQGVWVPFLGREVYTMTLLGKLAQQTGAAVLLSHCERLGIGKGFRIIIEQLNPHEFSDVNATPEQTASALNRGLEQLIRRLPGQYLWGYARDKQPRDFG